MRPPSEPVVELQSEVPGDSDGATLAAVVRALRPELSWRQAKDLCSSGRVLLEGAAVRDPARRAAKGQRIELLRDPSADGAAKPILVHVDSAVAVVNKPAGVLTVPVDRSDHDTLIHRAAAAVRRWETKRGGKGSPSLRAVQRLDRETSGLLVFARTIPAERHLQDQLKARTVWRRYLALVEGHMNEATFVSHLLENRGDGLRGSWERRRGSSVTPPRDARSAITHVQVEERLPTATLVACRLETGRQHQIRIHLSEAGHPLIGETVYVRDPRRGPTCNFHASRPLLHALELGFEHPGSGETLRFAVEPPTDFQAALAELRRRT
ncbi:MAG: RluA family pseudouridine synthase [Acidobacteriota bacterium]